MERQTVSSRNIRSIGYEHSTSTLEVEFNNGRVYQYFSVSENIFNSLLSASSKGQYLAANIVSIFRYKEV